MKLTKEQWDAAPETAEWFAVDKSGQCWFYTHEPKKGDICWWCPDYGTAFKQSFHMDCDWENSLQQRPKETVSVDPEVLKALNRKIAELEAELEQYKPKPKVTDKMNQF
jgi:hypothetical protein